MSNTKGRKLISLVLAALMAGSAFATAISAADTADAQADKSSSSGMSLATISDVLSTISYQEYTLRHKDATDAVPTVNVDFSDYNREETTAEVELLDSYNGKSGTLIRTGDTGKVTFNINVPETGMYAIRWSYCPVAQKTSTIERVMSVNGSVPYSEARNVHMKKSWVSEYTTLEDGTVRFATDTQGNEISPKMTADMVWNDYVFTDSDGYYSEPLRLYFEKGANTVSLEAVREDVVLADMQLYAYEKVKSYSEVLSEYDRLGYKNATADPIYISAEMPSAVSDYQICPVNDQVSSKTEPQSASATLLNTIGYGRWDTSGQWIEYKFNVQESGIYAIALRFDQSNEGAYVSRRMYIDGELPYEEAGDIKFYGDSKWQLDYLNDGEEDLKVYLEKGEHTIRFEVTLGELGDILRRASEVQSALNDDYLEILRLTGANPDEYRDYGFMRVMPDTLADLVDQAQELYSIVAYIEELNGKSDLTTTITQIADLADKMGRDEDKVAVNLTTLKSNLGTLGSWVINMASQPMGIDYILIQSPDTKLERANSNFFESTVYEFRKFLASFYVDYNALSSTGETVSGEPVEVWTSSSREKAQIIKNLIDSKFSKENNIPVTLKLVSAGTLLPSVLAGIGPDIALEGMTNTAAALLTSTSTSPEAGSIIDYAIRGAVLELQDFDGFDEVVQRFNPTSFEPVSLYGKTYGIPVSFSFNMMFYRTDILADLGLEIPKTWDELLSLIPVLQFNNMEVGLSADIGGFATFIYQNGGQFWADDGMRVNFDDNRCLESFEQLCNMFTQYSLPLTYDSQNRFRTGELPLYIGDYLSYNNIIIFATELAGRWSFGSIPGTIQEDGTIDSTTVGSSDAVIMLRGCNVQDEAWEFMKWYSDKDYQVEYANELVTVLGEAAKNNPANLEAIEELSWTKDEYDALMEQAQHVVCLKQYPGSYFISRYVTFGIQNAYNEGADPVESLLGYLNSINKEITRKRAEFGYETLETGQTLAEKRESQASDELNGLSEADANNYREELDAAREAIEMSEDNAKIEALRQSADKLERANGELFGPAVGYLRDAAAALESYQ